MNELIFPCNIRIKKDDVTGCIIIGCGVCDLGTAMTGEQFRDLTPYAAPNIGTLAASLIDHPTCRRHR